MGLSCGAKVLKYCLFAFNLIFVVAGIVCLSIGIWLIADPYAVDTMAKAFQDMKSQKAIDAAATGDGQGSVAEDLSHTPNAVRNLGILLASAGGVILVIAFLGCCGAVKEWRPLLVLYAAFLMVILATEIAAAIYAAVNQKTIEHDFKSYMASSLKFYGGNNSHPNPMRIAWDVFMNNSDCCGVHAEWPGERGFNRSEWKSEILKACPKETVFYPPVCCGKNGKGDVITDGCAVGYSYCPARIANSLTSIGCYEKFKNVLENKTAIIIGVGVAVGLIQIVGVIFALCLCRAISHEEP